MIKKRPEKIRAVLYARFSPRPNADDCESVEQQLVELREYCSKRGYKIEAEFSDRALSGKISWDDRPGMLRAESACKRGMLFIVRAWDRLFRDTQKGLHFAGILKAKGATVRSITEPAASLETPEAKLMMTIFLGTAEYQRNINNARTSARMKQHQRAGRRMSKLPPWGMMVDPNDPRLLVKNFEEIATVALIIEIYKTHTSFRAVCRELTRRGIRSRKGPWRHSMIVRILVREGVLAKLEKLP